MHSLMHSMLTHVQSCTVMHSLAVRALLAQMEEDDKEEFFADAKKQGF